MFDVNKESDKIRLEGGASRVVINKKYFEKPIAIGNYETVGLDFDVYVSTNETLLKQFKNEFENVKEINVRTSKQAIDEFVGL